MEMEDKISMGTALSERIDMHPRHDSWARITTHNSLVGVAIFLVLAALFIIVIALHLNRSALEVIGVLGGFSMGMIILCLIWKGTPQNRRGFLGNALLTVRIKGDLITELGANNVNVDSSKGVVTLRGAVPYADFREAAEQVARRRGAHHVIDELKVAPGAPGRPDSYLQGIPWRHRGGRWT